ncbi:MAG: dynamin family protein [Pseudomonadota bacterium]
MNDDKLNRELKRFLISCREKTGYSQSDVAARSDILGIGKVLDQKAVSRLEQAPLGADTLKLSAYLSAVGVETREYFDLLNELTHKKDYPMTNVGSSRKGWSAIEKASKKIESAKLVIKESSHSYLKNLGTIEQLDTAETLLDQLKGKTTIGVFGHFDAGKSTVLNVILGQDLLPTKYQPATSVVNLLMHTSDRPPYIAGQVAVFKRGFKPHMINSPKLVDHYLIEQGDKEILRRLGVHNYDDDLANEAYIAIVFSEAEILQNVWLLDTPGDMNSADESDTEKALAGVELVDGIVYVSAFTGFLKDGDLGLATNILRQKPPVSAEAPLEHVLFLQSHCHSEVPPEAIEEVRQTSFKRLKSQFNELVFQAWLDDGAITELPTPQTLSQRTQPFWRENENYRQKTIKSVQDMASTLLEKRAIIVETRVSQVLNDLRQALVGGIHTLESRKEAAVERMKEVKEQEARFRSEADDTIKSLHELVQSCGKYHADSLEDLKAYYDAKTSVAGLEQLIRETYDDRKEAQKGIGDFIGQLLTSKTESVLKLHGRAISSRLDELLDSWQSIIPKIGSEAKNLEFDQSSFNAKAAFVGGLSGLSSFGAMAMYVSTIASNLGAYILVGKVAGVLVSMGIVGSVTTVTSFVAAIGGPITIGIAIAAAIGYLIYRITGGSWQKSLAKKVASAIEDKNVWDKIDDVVEKFWSETQTAMNSGVDALVAETENHIEHLKADAAREFNHEDLDICINTLQMTKKELDEEE